MALLTWTQKLSSSSRLPIVKRESANRFATESALESLQATEEEVAAELDAVVAVDLDEEPPDEPLTEPTAEPATEEPDRTAEGEASDATERPPPARRPDGRGVLAR